MFFLPYVSTVDVLKILENIRGNQMVEGELPYFYKKIH